MARLTALEEAGRKLEAQAAGVAALEASLWAEQREAARAARGLRRRMVGLRDRDLRYRDTLARMRHISVHNDAFFIWHRGPFVTISGLRLGRIQGQMVRMLMLMLTSRSRVTVICCAAG